jgi:neutral trehalase
MDDPQKLGTIRTTSIVPVDLNALMFKMEKLLARASQDSGDSAARVNTRRWQPRVRKPSRATCGMIKRAGTPITT